MKPITDAFILSLIERADRQKPANDGPAPLDDQANKPMAKRGRLISLDFVRNAARRPQTVSGVFCYAPRA